MAIRPVDLRLAYMAAPQNAAILNSAQEAPQAAEQAAFAAFAAEATRREEHIDQPEKVHGAKVRAREERQHSGDRGRQHQRGDAREDEALVAGEHIIDVTA